MYVTAGIGSNCTVVAINGQLRAARQGHTLSGNEIVVTALKSTDVLIRRITVDVTKEIASVVGFQVEPLLPLPLDEMVWDYTILRKKQNHTEVTVFAVPKTKLEVHLREMRERGIDPERVSCIPAALTIHSKKPIGILHRADEVSCLIVHEGKVLAAHAFKEATNQEIEKAFYAMQTRCRVSLDRIIFAFGPYAIPLGLTTSTINFYKKAPFPWRRMRKRLVITASLILALTLSCWGLSEVLLTRKHAAIEAEYASLQALAEKPHENLANLSANQILRQANTLEKELSAVPADYPLIPLLPQVSEFISWLSGHNLPIQIDKLHYEMIHRPSKKRPKEHYQVRAHLSFSSPSPTVTRKLHDLLTQENALIDSKQPIQWNTSSELIHTSFILKDRTLYQ